MPRLQSQAGPELTVALLTESPLVADLLTLALGQSGISVVATGSSLDDLAPQLDVLAVEPGILVASHGYAEPDAVRERLARQAPSCRLVVVSLPLDRAAVLDWAEAGALGLMTYDVGVDELVRCIQSVAAGHGSCPPAITAILLDRVRTLRFAREATPASEPLTPREHQVARMVERGLSNKEIARELDITVSTVKNHVHNILTKLDLANRTRLRPSRLSGRRS